VQDLFFADLIADFFQFFWDMIFLSGQQEQNLFY